MRWPASVLQRRKFASLCASKNAEVSLEEVMEGIYAAEENCSIYVGSDWDGGWDEMPVTSTRKGPKSLRVLYHDSDQTGRSIGETETYFKHSLMKSATLGLATSSI